MTHRLSQIAEALGARLEGAGDLLIDGLAEPRDARAGDLALAMSEDYGAALSYGAARAALLWPEADWRALGLEAALYLDRPKAAMPVLTRLIDTGPDIAPGIHETAVIGQGASIGAGASIGPFAVIGAGVTIGANVRIGAHVSIGRGSRLGDDVLLMDGVRIAHEVTIGHRFIAQPNSVVGGDGFSFVTPEKASAVETLRSGEGQGAPVEGSAHWARVHSLGGVVIGDDVELGAGSTIDRGTIRATRIGRGTKIDNQVQIGHNCEVGEDCLMCGNVGVAGSVKIGSRVVLAGKVGVSDNIFIGDDVIAGGGTNIYTNVPSGRAVLGSPAVKIETEMAIRRELRRLPRLAETLRDLQKTVAKLGQKD